MAKVKLFVTAKGNCLALYSPALEKMADQIGRKTIRRASEVEFNNVTQLWEVKLKNKDTEELEVVATDTTRQGALDQEKEIVEQGLTEEWRTRSLNTCTNSSP